MPKPITLRDIAAHAGVSLFTVSAALRQDPRVAKPTQQRVREIADALGYRRDPYVAALMSNFRRGRSVEMKAEIALVLLIRAKSAFKYPSIQSLVEGIRERGNELGYQIELFDPLGEGPSLDRIGRICWARGIEGVIFTTSAVPDIENHLSHFDWQSFACAMQGRNISYPKIHRADWDYVQAVHLAWHHTAEAKRQRIGFCVPTVIERYSGNRYRMAMDFFRAKDPTSLSIPVYEETAWDREAFRKWLEEHRPDTVISTDHHLIVEIEAAGFRVPEEISFVGLGLWDYDPRLSGVVNSHRDLGSYLLDLVDAQLQRNERGVPRLEKLMLCPPRWHDGETLAPSN